MRCLHPAIERSFYHLYHLQCWLFSSPRCDPIRQRERQRERVGERERERERITTRLLTERETILAVIGQEVGCLDVQALLLSAPPPFPVGSQFSCVWLPSVPPHPPFPLSVRLSPRSEGKTTESGRPRHERFSPLFSIGFAPPAAGDRSKAQTWILPSAGHWNTGDGGDCRKGERQVILL